MKTHNNIEITDSLYDFLDGEGVLALFTANCNYKEVESIDEAFVWHDTKEGQEFWQELCELYLGAYNP